MATIRYRIADGLAPFTVELYESAILVDTDYHAVIGDYYFTNLPDGTYTIRIIDVTTCFIEFESIIDCITTTTTIEPTTTTTTTCYLTAWLDYVDCEYPTTTTSTTIEPATTTSTSTLEPITTTTTTTHLCEEILVDILEITFDTTTTTTTL